MPSIVSPVPLITAQIPPLRPTHNRYAGLFQGALTLNRPRM